MKISMHAMSHDVFKKALTQLLHVMEKAVASAKARNFETECAGRCAARARHAAVRQADPAHQRLREEFDGPARRCRSAEVRRHRDDDG